MIDSLHTDVDSIIEMIGTEPESAPIELVEEIMLYPLFKPFAEPRGRTKRHRSSRTCEAGDDSRVRKRERMDLEAFRRVFLVNKEARKIRAQEMVAGASSSIMVTGEHNTTDGVEIDLGTTEGEQVLMLQILGNQTRTLVERLSMLCASGLLHLPPCTCDFLCIGDYGMLFLSW